MSFSLTVDTWDLAAGVPKTIYVPGTFFQIMAANAAVDVEFLSAESNTGIAKGVPQGFSAGPEEKPFQAVRLTSATTQTVQLCISRGKVDLRQVVGNVAISNMQGGFTEHDTNGSGGTAPAVTNASGQLLAANAARRFLLVQNNDAAGNVFLNLGGAAATLGGLKLGPGASILLDAFVPTGAINAIGDIASNANVVVIEG